MKKNNCLILLLFIGLIYSCGEKKYEDYNENEFNEVQGVITKVKQSSSPFDSSRVRDIEYFYYLGEKEPFRGGEKNIDLYLNSGQPIVVLVHKKDSTINFYGYNGMINIEELQKGAKYIKNETNLLNE
jgi:hypothetical protein